MSSAIEALGMSLPYSSSNPANSPEKVEELKTVGKAMKHLLEIDLKPKDIMTKKSFENALRLIIILGGSTNAVMHLIAMARTIDVDITIDDFQRMSDETPFLADLKPSGKYLMEDLHAVGGVPAVMKYLLEKGLIHGDCMTVTGKTVAENLMELPGFTEGQDVIMPLDKPIKETGHIRILYGNLAEEGSVAKITGKEGLKFEGPAIVFDDEFEAIDGILNGKVVKGNVIVIRYEGPKGGPGMPEMLKPTSAVMGKGLGKDVAMITDGRFSGGSHGFVVGHICPEAQEGGMIGLVQDGDIVTIDAVSNTINVAVSDAEIAKRKAKWVPKELPKRGVLAKYARQVSTASKGCMTDDF